MSRANPVASMTTQGDREIKTSAVMAQHAKTILESCNDGCMALANLLKEHGEGTLCAQELRGIGHIVMGFSNNLDEALCVMDAIEQALDPANAIMGKGQQSRAIDLDHMGGTGPAKD